MDQRIRATVATTGPLTDRPLRFSREDLDKIAETAPGVPVFASFDARDEIGRVESAERIGEAVTVAAAIRRALDGGAPLFCVPGCYTSEDQGGVVRVYAFSLTTKPADPSLPPLEILP